jgi:hypothetical protein
MPSFRLDRHFLPFLYSSILQDIDYVITVCATQAAAIHPLIEWVSHYRCRTRAMLKLAPTGMGEDARSW